MVNEKIFAWPLQLAVCGLRLSALAVRGHSSQQQVGHGGKRGRGGGEKKKKKKAKIEKSHKTRPNKEKEKPIRQKKRNKSDISNIRELALQALWARRRLREIGFLKFLEAF